MNLSKPDIDLLKQVSKDENSFLQLTDFLNAYGQNAALLSSILGTLLDQIAVFDRHGQTLYTNVRPEDHSMFPGSPEINAVWEHFTALAESYVDKPSSNVETSSHNPKISLRRTRLVAGEDHGQYLEDIWQPIFGPHCTFHYLMVTTRDITDRVIQQNALIEQNPNPMARLDRDGHFIYANSAMVQVLGHSPPELIGKSMADVGLRKSVVSAWQRELHQVSTSGQGSKVEFTTWLKDHDEKPNAAIGSATVSPAYIVHFIPESAADSGNQNSAATPTVSTIAVMIQDNTRWQYAADQEIKILTHEVASLQTQLDALPQHITVLDDHGTLVSVNKAWREFGRTNGFQPLELGIGENYLEICDRATGEGSAGAHLIAENIRAMLRGQKEFFSMEYPCPTPHELLWFNVTLTPFRLDGVPYVMAAHHDITNHRKLERALEHSQHIYQLLASNLPNNAVFLYDLDLRYTLAEGPTIELAGIKKSDYVGRRLRDVMPAEVYERDEPTLLAALRGERTRVEVTYLDLTYEVMTLPIRDHDQTIVGGMVITTDITERKQIEESLTTVLDQYRMLENSINDVISMHNVHGDFLYISPSVERILGWSPHELLGGRGIGTLYPEAFEPHITKFMTDLLNEHDKQVVAQCRRKDGSIAWMEIFGHVIEDAGGQSYRLVTSSREITRRVKAEEMLRESEERYRLLATNSLDTAFYQDLEQRYVWVANPKSTWHDSTVIGQTDLALLPEPIGQTLTEIKTHVLNEDISATTEFRIHQRSDDADHIYEVTYVPRHNNAQQVIGLAGYLRDITERKRIEQAMLEQEKLRIELQKEAELNQLKSRMMMRIAHEFRTPLAIIQTFTELLSKNYTDFQVNFDKYSQIIRDEIFAVVKMLDNISLVVRGETHQLTLSPSTFSVDQLCRDIIQGFKAVMLEPRLIEVRTQENLPHITADKEMLRSIISNLLSNALKYSKAPQPVEFDLSATEHEVTIKVIDHGIGISADDLQRVYEPFYRGQNVERVGGIGIGMSILKDAVELHQGRIEIESTLGEGTCIIVHLPITRF